MSITWTEYRASDGQSEHVETFETIDDCLESMAELAGEEDTSLWTGVLCDDATGAVVGTSLKTCDGSTLVLLADGRLYSFPGGEVAAGATIG